MDYRIPEKANKVLNIILLSFLLILIRVWYLSIIQHEELLERARSPKRRTVIERVERATIRDRSNIPLALNQIQYSASVCYADIRSIPAAKWEIGPGGKRVRVQKRLQYIQELSQFLSRELQIDAQKIEDTIHGRASLFPHTPFVIKENLSEEEYYRLKAIEKDWVGVRMEHGSVRIYPQGKVGCDLIGHLGSINLKEYVAIADELKQLQTYLADRENGEAPVLPKGFNNPLEVRERVRSLQEKSYTIRDLTGKSGIEGSFDAELRGYAGKKIYEVDTRGNIQRELPGGRKSVPGQRLLLSISAELQQRAEELLIDNEATREARHSDGSPDLSTPWMKGGAIVAIDPKTGEILALASYPRIDPNDFVPSGDPETRAAKQAAIHKWLEDETCIGEIWEGKRPLERERWDQDKGVYEEALPLTWDRYLETLLDPGSHLLSVWHSLTSMHPIFLLQEAIGRLLTLSEQSDLPALIEALYPGHTPSRLGSSKEVVSTISTRLGSAKEELATLRLKTDPLLASLAFNDDKLLFLDLCRLLLKPHSLSSESAAALHSFTPATYHLLAQRVASLKNTLKAKHRQLFHAQDFQRYRETEFKEFLKAKRREEKDKRQHAKPYTDYLDELEKEQFATFWRQHAQEILLSSPECNSTAERSLIASLPSFDELQEPLYGRYRSLRHKKGVQLEKHLASAFYPLSGYGYGRSQAFRQSTPQGSVFKLLIGYLALLEKYESVKEIDVPFGAVNPLTIVDNLKWHAKPGSSEQILGYTLEGKPIQRAYKGGLLIKSHPNIGKIDLIGALEQSSNLYFSLLASDCIHNPERLIETARQFGFGEKTGIELPGEIRGSLPGDLSYNKTGLYAFAIGQHSLVVTPLQTALMLSALANQGKLLKPKIVHLIAGQEPLRDYQDPFDSTRYPFQHQLSAVGIDFPLFTALHTEEQGPLVWVNSPECRRTLPLPPCIRTPLMQGMNRVITGAKGTARPEIIRALSNNPEWAHHFHSLKGQLIGKTGTAEILYKQTLDTESKAVIKNHIWFSGISFPETDQQRWEDPELVVVVYLRFSRAGGKEAAPLASEIVKKYREILSRSNNR